MNHSPFRITAIERKPTRFPRVGFGFWGLKFAYLSVEL